MYICKLSSFSFGSQGVQTFPKLKMSHSTTNDSINTREHFYDVSRQETEKWLTPASYLRLTAVELSRHLVLMDIKMNYQLAAIIPYICCSLIKDYFLSGCSCLQMSGCWCLSWLLLHFLPLLSDPGHKDVKCKKLARITSDIAETDLCHVSPGFRAWRVPQRTAQLRWERVVLQHGWRPQLLL